MARLFTIQNSGCLKLQLLDTGASWHACYVTVDGVERQILLNDSPASYPLASYAGATVGRYAGRIANARYYDGQALQQLNVNTPPHCLHGGENSLSHRQWQVTALSQTSVTFSCQSVDGDQGFPGNFNASVTYCVTEDNCIIADYQASCDQRSPCNLTNHAYFNLSGETLDSALTQTLIMPSHHYLPVGKDGIPIDEPLSVNNTSFDFRQAKSVEHDFLADEQQKNVGGYDHSFLINDYCAGQLSLAATLTSADESLSMQVSTTHPAIHLYSGNFLASPFEPYAGIALETQSLPNSPNHANWQGAEQAWVSPDKPYHQRTVYQFVSS